MPRRRAQPAAVAASLAMVLRRGRRARESRQAAVAELWPMTEEDLDRAHADGVSLEASQPVRNRRHRHPASSRTHNCAGLGERMGLYPRRSRVPTRFVRKYTARAQLKPLGAPEPGAGLRPGAKAPDAKAPEEPPDPTVAPALDPTGERGEETYPWESACGPVRKRPEEPPTPYRPRASPRLYTDLVGTLIPAPPRRPAAPAGAPPGSASFPPPAPRRSRTAPDGPPPDTPRREPTVAPADARA